jgi:hypothetical protein
MSEQQLKHHIRQLVQTRRVPLGWLDLRFAMLLVITLELLLVLLLLR